MHKLTAIMKFLFLTTIIFAFTFQSDFLNEQKKYVRVRTAIKEKGRIIEQHLTNEGLELTDINLLLIAYKDIGELELYVKHKNEKTYKHVDTYIICSNSGKLGPKRKQGDYQVPEGFYHIDRFNPSSNFYLSLGLNYPNKSDRKKSKSSNLGGDIFIHGACVTIGCLPMTNDKIKEIYLYAVYGRNNGQTKIPVYIFPFKMNDRNFTKYKTKYSSNAKLIAFWTNLKAGYDKFDKEKAELEVKISDNGDYQF